MRGASVATSLQTLTTFKRRFCNTHLSWSSDCGVTSRIGFPAISFVDKILSKNWMYEGWKLEGREFLLQTIRRFAVLWKKINALSVVRNRDTVLIQNGIWRRFLKRFYVLKFWLFCSFLPIFICLSWPERFLCCVKALHLKFTKFQKLAFKLLFIIKGLCNGQLIMFQVCFAAWKFIQNNVASRRDLQHAQKLRNIYL